MPNRREFFKMTAAFGALSIFPEYLWRKPGVPERTQNTELHKPGWQHFGRVIPEALQTYQRPLDGATPCPLYDHYDHVSAVYPRRSLIRYDEVSGFPGWGIILGERSAFHPQEKTWSHVQPDNVSFVLGSYFRLADLEPWTSDSELTVLPTTVPGGKYIEVDLRSNEFHLRLYELDVQLRPTLVLQTLIAGNPELTPAGEFPITAKKFVDTMVGVSRASGNGYNHYSVELSMQFTSAGEKLHGSAFMEADRFPDSWLRGNIRRVVRSNGCVRIPEYSAEEFLAWQTSQDVKDGVLEENPGEREDYFFATPEFMKQFSQVPLIEFVFRWTLPHVDMQQHFEGLELSLNNPEQAQMLSNPYQVTRVVVIK